MPSQRVTNPSFHRRILPWIFVVVFLAIAPTVVFYTAGYRWNSSKGKVERNGTAIIDSLPPGARVAIDNRETNYKTPVTIQDMPPGMHNFKIFDEGYHDWSKNLEVKAELVTFINNVWLWKKSSPVFVMPGEFQNISISPDKRYLIKLSRTSSTQALVTDLLTNKTQSLNLEKGTGTEYVIDWSPNSEYVLLKAKSDASDTDWLLDAKNGRNLGKLPVSEYRFSNDALSGISNGSLISIRLRDAAVSRMTLSPGVVDEADDVLLKNVAGTAGLVYMTKSKPDQGFILPEGNWKFWDLEKNYVILNDGRKWLTLVGHDKPEEYRSAEADQLLPFKDSSGKRFLLVNNSEIWTWQPQHEPALIYRQTDKIIDAAWHTGGSDIFFATDKKIYAINLDQRDGYLLTELAQFDEIYSFAYLKGSLQIAANLKDKTGVWSLAVE